jgi:hypothetical protein
MLTVNPRPAALTGLLMAALLVGCAGTAPKPTFSQPMAVAASITAGDASEVAIDAPQSMEILPQERDRLAQKVKLRIEARKATNARIDPPRSYQVLLRLSRYEKGSKFARAMLAGLGQIHIDGTVSVFQMPEHTLIGEFELKKTFAWGGIYGASTDIEAIEDTFADAVAATVTGQQETPKQKT